MASNDGRRGYIYHTALSALKQNRHRCEKAARLLDRFGTLASLKNVTAAEIAAVKGISEKDGQAVWAHYHGEDGEA